MHIYIAGLGGFGMRQLVELASAMGYEISGSDIRLNEYLRSLQKNRPDIKLNIGQTAGQIASLNREKPVDWYIYSSALAFCQPPNPELKWAEDNGLRASKRDEFINHCLSGLKLEMLAVSGSHGKTTTTAMIIWTCHQLKLPVSYALGGEMYTLPTTKIAENSSWFIYEADEFDRNFLSFRPKIALITGMVLDHHEIYPDKASYEEAFLAFSDQAEKVIISASDYDKISRAVKDGSKFSIVKISPAHQQINLVGEVNRQNATLALRALKVAFPDIREAELIKALNSFPGLRRRFEKLAENLYTDYAHTIPKIRGCLQIASEMKKPIVVIYEPHDNRRQQFINKEYRDLFAQVEKIYWLPTYLAREDPNLKIIRPDDFIAGLSNPQKAEVAECDQKLKLKIKDHLQEGHLVVGITAGALDDWLRKNFC